MKSLYCFFFIFLLTRHWDIDGSGRLYLLSVHVQGISLSKRALPILNHHHQKEYKWFGCISQWLTILSFHKNITVKNWLFSMKNSTNWTLPLNIDSIRYTYTCIFYIIGVALHLFLILIFNFMYASIAYKFFSRVFYIWKYV